MRAWRLASALGVIVWRPRKALAAANRIAEGDESAWRLLCIDAAALALGWRGAAIWHRG